jgi:hypothetical protein
MIPLRPGLLDGQTIALAAGGQPAIASRVEELGAEVHEAEALSFDDETAAAWAREHAPLNALVLAVPDEAAGEHPDRALEPGWALLRAVAAETLIPSEQGGKLLLLAPRPGAGTHAEAVRAAVENLARTLSVEWARHAVTVTAIAPGDGTGEHEVADLVAYLLSPAGDYFSGGRLLLGAIGSRGLLHSS